MNLKAHMEASVHHSDQVQIIFSNVEKNTPIVIYE